MSADRKKWVLAANVKGLHFLPEAVAGPSESRDEVVLASLVDETESTKPPTLQKEPEQWFLLAKGTKKVGPFTMEELRTYCEARIFEPDLRIRKCSDSWCAWVNARSTYPDLCEAGVIDAARIENPSDNKPTKSQGRREHHSTAERPAISRDDKGNAALPCIVPHQTNEKRESKAELRKKLAEPSSGRRLLTADSLHELGETKWQEWIKGDAKDFDRLAGSGDSDAVDVLIHAVALGRPMLDSNVTPELGASKAAVRLGELGEPRAVEALIEQLGNTDRDIVFHCITALCKLGDDRAVRPLIDLLKTKDKVLVQRFSQDMDTRTYSMLARTDLQTTAKGTADALRSWAMEALKRFDDRKANRVVASFHKYESDLLGDTRFSVLRRTSIGWLGDLPAVAKNHPV
ncbi:MAG: HEAT repeat domain-containing protein [Planctomycetes bacterium]|nr:HEAT repeat domain-containing protein [Planctomycetota bacterium]